MQTSCRMFRSVTPTQYIKIRKRIGSQEKVALILGVNIRTVQRREVGDIPITGEAARAIMALAAREMAQRVLALDRQIFRPDIEEILVLLK